MDFIADKLHPQYSAMLGKDVTFSCWIYAANSMRIRIGLDVTDDQSSNETDIIGGQWNYVQGTFHSVTSRPPQPPDDFTPRIMLFIRQANSQMASVEPFYIDGTVLEIGDKANHPVISMDFIDAMGKVIQSHLLKLGSDNSTTVDDSVTVVQYKYDSQNRLISKSLPIHLGYIFDNPQASSGNIYSWEPYTNIEMVDALDAAYGETGNPYTQYSYMTDGTNRIERTSLPGTQYNIDGNTSNGHIFTQYNYNVAGEIASPHDENDTTFIPATDGKPAPPLSDDGALCQWNYSVNTIASGLQVYNHSIIDAQGNTVLTYATQNGQDLLDGKLLTMRRFNYDPAGNLTKEYAPSCFADLNDKTICTNRMRDDRGAVTEYVYDGANRLIKRISTDIEGNTEYRYDKFGTLRFVQDPNHSQKGSYCFIVYQYDPKGRLSKILDVIAKQDADYFNSQDCADDPKWPVGTNIINMTVLHEYDLSGKLIKVKAFSDALKNYAQTKYTYNEDDNLTDIVEKVPGFRPKTHHYIYFNNGLVKSYEFMTVDDLAHFVREMVYDNTGKLLNVSSQGKAAQGGNADEINYAYNDPRSLMTKAQIGPIPQQQNGSIYQTNAYDVQGKLTNLSANKKITGTEPENIFKQEIVYDESNFSGVTGSYLTPQYNGNIAGIRYHGINPSQLASGEKFKYSYDFLGRLSSSEYTEETANISGLFNTTHNYFLDGNIKRNSKKVIKEVGGAGGGTTMPEQDGDYYYYDKTHRLKAIEGDLRGVSESGIDEQINFVYDPNGNLIEDKTKNLKIEYDWRNMPTKFILKDGTVIKYVSQIVYDASGNRIAKLEYGN